MPRTYGPETEIVCHKEGKHLYDVPALSTKTYFSTRAKATTPIQNRLNGFLAGCTTKQEWKEEDLVTVCTRAQYNQHWREKGWLVRQAAKKGVIIADSTQQKTADCSAEGKTAT